MIPNSLPSLTAIAYTIPGTVRAVKAVALKVSWVEPLSRLAPNYGQEGSGNHRLLAGLIHHGGLWRRHHQPARAVSALPDRHVKHRGPRRRRPARTPSTLDD